MTKYRRSPAFIVHQSSSDCIIKHTNSAHPREVGDGQVTVELRNGDSTNPTVEDRYKPGITTGKDRESHRVASNASHRRNFVATRETTAFKSTSMEGNTMSKKTVKVHCSACSRPEWHKPARVHPVLGATAMILTLGMASLMRPYRCTCCGHTRFGANKPQPRVSKG